MNFWSNPSGNTGRSRPFFIRMQKGRLDYLMASTKKRIMSACSANKNRLPVGAIPTKANFVLGGLAG